MAEPKIIYEDNDFVAVNKPAGLLTHPAKNKEELALTDWLLRRYPEIKNVGDNPGERPGIVHRLDKETSGVVLVARSQKTFDYLKSLFKNRKIKKTYLALVFGKVWPRKGRIERRIGIKSGTLKRSVHSDKFAKPAVTEYEVGKYLQLPDNGGEFFTLLKVMPETGRTHQIRVHLAGIHHPVVGDRLYGRKNQPEWAKRLMLHAEALEFTETEGRRIKIGAEPPPDFPHL